MSDCEKIESAIKWFEDRLEIISKTGVGTNCAMPMELAVDALKEMLQRNKIWHDAESDPPPQDGLYYGKKDDTNSMWAVRYENGNWGLSGYMQEMPITKWAFWDAFD